MKVLGAELTRVLEIPEIPRPRPEPETIVSQCRRQRHWNVPELAEHSKRIGEKKFFSLIWKGSNSHASRTRVGRVFHSDFDLFSTSTCLIHPQESSRRNHACCDHSRGCSRGVIDHCLIKRITEAFPCPFLHLTLLMISKVVDVRGSLCSTCKYSNNISYHSSESFSE